MGNLPAGTVTFLLTDIEDSSAQWERDGDAMQDRLTLHDSLIRSAVEDNGGAVIKHMGDGCWAAFPTAPQAADAAVDFRRELDAQPDDVRSWLRVRIGLHTGDVDPTEDHDYFGPVPNRSARVAGLANGNQIVCSAPTAALLTGYELRSEGLHDLKGIGVEEIFLLLVDGLDTDDRPLRRPVAASNLPRIHTSFVGRKSETGELTTLLDQDHSVVTLAGPGGVGKTRLAVEAGQQLAAERSMSVVFCDLAPVGDGEALLEAVAEGVGARRQPGMDVAESISDYLSNRDLVLILDNCEHLTEPVAELVAGLDGLDSVTLLATSREALRVQGEQVLVLEPLDPESSAVELFVERARERDSAFVLAPGDEKIIVEIVRRLDGIPLAIELAAARTRIMNPAELADRLDDRFALLGGDGDRPRHETLHAAVSWSYRLLEPAEAELFERLSVFAGGFDLAAAEAVCADDELVHQADVADLVLGLVDKSMIRKRSHRGRTRFEMLETLRSFGAAQLIDAGHADHFRRRHADHFLATARRQNERMFTSSEHDAWAVLDREWTNLRAALDTFEREADVDSGAGLVVSLMWFATMSMRYELFSWADELLAGDGIEDHKRFTDLCGASAFGAYFRVRADAAAIAERGLTADPSDPEGFCRTATAAVLLNNLHAAEASDALTTEWLAAPPATVGSRMWAEAFRTFHLCTHAPSKEAAVHAAALQRMAAETGSMTVHAVAAWAQGQVVSFRDLDQAVEIWTQGLEWPRSAPSDHLVEHLLTGLILHVSARGGDLLDVLNTCRNALGAAVESHYNVGISHLFGVSAIALCRAGDAETGARLIGAMLAHGHIPRSNAKRAIEDALGADADDHVTAGMALSITGASHLALDALEGAAVRVREAAA